MFQITITNLQFGLCCLLNVSAQHWQAQFETPTEICPRWDWWAQQTRWDHSREREWKDSSDIFSIKSLLAPLSYKSRARYQDICGAFANDVLYECSWWRNSWKRCNWFVAYNTAHSCFYTPEQLYLAESIGFRSEPYLFSCYSLLYTLHGVLHAVLKWTLHHSNTPLVKRQLSWSCSLWMTESAVLGCWWWDIITEKGCALKPA